MESWRFRTATGDLEVGVPAALRATGGHRLPCDDPRLGALIRDLGREPEAVDRLRNLLDDLDRFDGLPDLDARAVCDRALHMLRAGSLVAIAEPERMRTRAEQRRAPASTKGPETEPKQSSEAKAKPSAFALAWSTRRAAVAEQVFAELTPRDCQGGEAVTLVFYEIDRDGTRTELGRETHTLANGKARVRIAWSRSEVQAEADRLEDSSAAGEAGDRLEYRFEVLVNDESAGESDSLLLTTTVDWKPSDAEGNAVTDGHLVECQRADGKKVRVPIKDGAARFEKVPIGATRFTVIPRVIERLAWSRNRVPAAEPVELVFFADGFAGGEDLVVTIFECDADGGRDEVETIETKLPKGKGDFVLQWKRGDAAAQQDLLDDLDSGDRLVEYRFTVTIDGTEAGIESTPLHLTFAATVAPLGPDGAPLPDGAVVACIEADGHVATARVHNGEAVFPALLLGRVEFVGLTPAAR